jgi:micrococcal nuclease
LGLVACTSFILLRIAYDSWNADSLSPGQLPLAEGQYVVARIVDGDTLVVQVPPAEDRVAVGETVRVRLLGVDCPETSRSGRSGEPWSQEAADFTAQFVAGHPVWLRFDKRRLDIYDRHLAYVFVGEQMLNEQLLRKGLARLMILPGDSESIARRLRAAEQEAQDARRGIWTVP